MTNSLRVQSGCRNWRDTAQFWGTVTLILVVRLIRTPLLSFRGNGVGQQLYLEPRLLQNPSGSMRLHPRWLQEWGRQGAGQALQGRGWELGLGFTE